MLKPGFAVFLDVDGVLLRGRKLLPAARRLFLRLRDQDGRLRCPLLFLTNTGSCLRREKARQLSHILGVQVTEQQVVLSHSPLQMFHSFHNKCVVVSGQGPVEEIAHDLGFTNVVTMEQLSERLPLLDAMDHNRHGRVPVSPLKELPRVEAIVLFGEPIRWETNLQLLMDVLMTNGRPGSAHVPKADAHLPVLACNTDLTWMADAPSPRFGHGVFLLCLQSVYRKFSGRKLLYQALMGKPSLLSYQYAEVLLRQQVATRGGAPARTIYAVGDNLTTDIYGANMFNRYLAQGHVTVATSAKMATRGTTAPEAMRDDMGTAAWENQLAPPTATRCQSILVCTGVYNPRSALPSDPSSVAVETEFKGHQDPDLMTPDHIVEDVEVAMELVFQREGLDL